MHVCMYGHDSSCPIYMDAINRVRTIGNLRDKSRPYNQSHKPFILEIDQIHLFAGASHGGV